MEEEEDDGTLFDILQPYSSCIVIKGKPILPPVMTPLVRKEMHEYKMLALEVEKRLRLNKTNKSRSQYLTIKSHILSSEKSCNDAADCVCHHSRISANSPIAVHEEEEKNLVEIGKKVTEGLEHGSNAPAQCSVVKDSDHCRMSPIHIVTEAPTPGVDLSTPPSVASTDLAKYMTATNDLEDRSALTDLGNSADSCHSCDSFSYHLEAPESGSVAMSDRSSRSTVVPDEQQNPLENPTIHNGELEPSSESSTKPIRRSSYTLEHPSPILIAHLQKLHQSNSVDDAQLQQSNNGYVTINKAEKQIEDEKNTVEDQSNRQEHLLRYLNQMASLNIINSRTGDPTTTPQLNSSIVRQVTDQSVVVNLSADSVNVTTQADSPASVFEYFLQKQQQRFERLRDELEEAQCEQLSRLKLRDANLNTENKSPSPSEMHDLHSVQKELTEMSVQVLPKKETLPSSHPAIMPPLQKDGLLHEPGSETQQIFNSTSDTASPKVTKNPSSCIRAVRAPASQFPFRFRTFDHSRNTNKEVMLPSKVFDAKMKLKFDRVSAAVKGYLTRRLMRTEKVQAIIKTIQDTLEFAFQLHLETPLKEGRVTPEDANLHQRLIAQLSSACYEFHDVFFKLTTKEKMMLISQDRLLMQGKLNKECETRKPLSAAKQKHQLSSATLKVMERKRYRANSSRQSSKAPSPYFPRGNSPRHDNSRRVYKQLLSGNVVRAHTTSPRMQRYIERSVSTNIARGETPLSEPSSHHRVRRNLYGQQPIIKAKRKAFTGRSRQLGTRSAT